MKFSLKRMVLFVVLFSWLAFSVFLVQENSKLKNRIREFGRSLGAFTQDYANTGKDRWELVRLGNLGTSDPMCLLRVRNYQDYHLRIHFFDGLTEEYRSDKYPLDSITTSICLVKVLGNVLIQETTVPCQSHLVFDFPVTKKNFYFHCSTKLSGQVTTEPIFGFATIVEGLGPRGVNGLRYMSRESIESTCRTHRMRAVWFSLEKR